MPLSHAESDASGPKFGLQTWTLRHMTFEQVVGFATANHIKYLQLTSQHLDPNASLEEIRRKKAVLDQHGLVAYTFGVNGTSTDNTANRKLFEVARVMGAKVIVVEPALADWDHLEELVKEYDIKLAIHNHGPGDVFPSPYDALKAVQGMDRRMGLCIDVGHTVRTGTDVVRAVADAGPRLLDMHAKDLRDLSVAESQCIVGEGKIPIAAIFRQLRASLYQGYVNLEYEIDANDPMPGMKQSFAYMRGVLGALAL